jgi:prepilin-type N-terminal cleavage/methylation domain-containing protein
MKSKYKQHSGFTVVELLIVIVVLAILVAIIIVSFNGIQRRAKEALITSNLDNVSRLLKVDQIANDNGQYPNTQSEANGGKGLPASQGVSYQYTVDNASFPQTYCVTASFNGIDYKITESTSSVEGVCSGHTASTPQIITNLSPNPSVETNTTGWTDTRGSSTRIAAAAQAGSYGMRMTVDTVGFFPRISTTTAAISPSTIYSISAWVRSSSQVRIAYAVNSGSITSGSLVNSNNQWVRLSITTPATAANAATLTPSVGVPDNSPVNTTFDVDGIIITQGTSTPSYADGSSPNWTWSGAVNNSTSTGPSP